MWVVPFAAAVIAMVFTFSLVGSYRRSHRVALLLWAIALAMYAIGCGAVAYGALQGFDATTFRLYWIFGAVLNVPFLAAGEIELLAPGRRNLSLILAFLLVVTVATLARTFGTPVDLVALSKELPSGREVFGEGSSAYMLPRLISTPTYLILLGGTLVSAWRMRGAPHLRDRFFGTLMIAGGATVIAGFGSAFAALGLLFAFSVSILAGVAVMFLGFRRAVRVAAT